ncbi:MAG: M24 family metallopeptidase [Acidobacteriia bacterium]|nr:M24 family metallopeptidase [Terriglobia bacterium]
MSGEQSGNFRDGRTERELASGGRGVPFRFTHELLKHTHSNLRDAEAICQGIRVTKDSAEIRSLQRAASILSKSFLKIPHLLKVGLTEVQLAQQISQTIYSSGAEFVTDILVQSGAFAADPHHLPSARRLKRKESIVIDTACSYSGYYADITRTFNIGHTPELEGIYENVLAAEEAAIKASKSGVAVGSIDAAARNHLKRAKLDGYFIHRTGHGLGLEVHEAPYIVADGAEIIQPSMAFTIEPGVYLPGKMGVRIEDDVLSTSQNCRVLTRTLPKEFEWWK